MSNSAFNYRLHNHIDTWNDSRIPLWFNYEIQCALSYRIFISNWLPNCFSHHIHEIETAIVDKLLFGSIREEIGEISQSDTVLLLELGVGATMDVIKRTPHQFSLCPSQYKLVYATVAVLYHIFMKWNVLCVFYIIILRPGVAVEVCNMWIWRLLAVCVLAISYSTLEKNSRQWGVSVFQHRICNYLFVINLLYTFVCFVLSCCQWTF